MNNNALAFTALCNEYCAAAEHAAATAPDEFVAEMLRLLPRIYITASDLTTDSPELDEGYIDSALEEDAYDTVRNSIASLLGEDDTYLEVFEEDMKYSDTPIATSVSENLADLFQVFYNYLEAVRDAPDHLVDAAIAAVKDDFDNYWSQILCNVLRPINSLRK